MSNLATFLHTRQLVLLLAGSVLALLISAACISPPKAYGASLAEFMPGRIIDDDVFAASGSMSPAQIQAFLNSKVSVCDTWGTQPSEFGGGTRAQWGTARGYPPPYTCLKDFSEGGRSAAQIIYDVAQQFQINPQVLIVLLQKEQGLVTDTWPTSNQYRSATGYGCPDTAPCDSQYYGLTNQLTWAARMFRSILNASPTWYTPYVMGNNYIRWNPQASCGGSTVNIETRATQALYNYTPYRPNQAALNAGYGTGDSCSAYGNRNFYLYFVDWFGSTLGSSYYTCRDGSNLSGVASGQKLLRNRLNSSRDVVSLTVANNTGTKCAEVHTWANSQMQAWIQHIGTNSYPFNPTYSRFVSARTSKTSSAFFKVDYQQTGSGKVEVHGWNSGVQRWVSHVASLAGPVSIDNSEIIPADTDGDGISEFYLVDYRNTSSGMVEFHGFTPNLQQWSSHIASNMPAVDPANGRVIAADFNGDGKDEFSYIKTGGVQSGYVEVHTWAAGQRIWIRHAATNLSIVDFRSAHDDVIPADQDGDGRDELLYVKYGNTGSGRLEVHGWNTNQTGWVSHIATSAASF